MGLGKFWPDLEIMKALVIGFKVLFLCDFLSRSLEFFKYPFRSLAKS